MRWRRLFLRLGGALSEGLGIMCCYYCSLNMPVYAVLQYTRTHAHIHTFSLRPSLHPVAKPIRPIPTYLTDHFTSP